MLLSHSVQSSFMDVADLLLPQFGCPLPVRPVLPVCYSAPPQGGRRVVDQTAFNIPSVDLVSTMKEGHKWPYNVLYKREYTSRSERSQYA